MHFTKLPSYAITVCKERLPLYSSQNVLLLGCHAPFNLHDYLVPVDTLKSQYTLGTVSITAESREDDDDDDDDDDNDDDDDDKARHMPPSGFIYVHACCA